MGGGVTLAGSRFPGVKVGVNQLALLPLALPLASLESYLWFNTSLKFRLA